MSPFPTLMRSQTKPSTPATSDAISTASFEELISAGESKPKAGLPEGELAAYTMIANMLLNLDETLNRN